MGQSKFSEANEHFRAGRYEQAVAIYEEIISEGGASFCVYENLGWAQERLGQFDLAFASYQLASNVGGKPQRLTGLLERAFSTYVPSRPLLTVIVPVYNAEAYVRECIETIAAQTLKNLEIIVVDDGSTDGSVKEISSAAEQDERIRVVANSRASGNPGTPRNQAIDAARGVYIGFVDSDDWVEPTYFGSLLSKALRDDADIAFASGFYNVAGGNREVRKYRRPPRSLKRYHESFMVWDKVFRRDGLEQYGIRLGNTPAAVDVPFILKAYFHLAKWTFCEDQFGYNYRRESPGSVTVSRRRNSDCSFEIDAYRAAENWADRYADAEYRQVIAFRKVASFVYTLGLISDKFAQSFYRKVRREFECIDPATVERFARLTGKPALLERFAAIRRLPDHKKYYSVFPSKGGGAPKSSWKNFGLNIKAPKNGILFFPDWSKTNPYQKLLYAAVASEYGVRIRGYSEGYFNREVLEKNRDSFDVIHLHWLHKFFDIERPGGESKLRRNLRLAKALGYKLAYTAHNVISHDATGAKLDREIAFRRAVIGEFDYILVHGAFAKQRLVSEIGADPSKVFVVEHGNYLGYYPNTLTARGARKKLGIRSDRFVLLFFGNIKSYKGVEPLLQAFGEVHRQYPSAQLVIAGRVFDARAIEAVESASKSMSIELRPEYIADNEVHLFFNAANVVVLPYRNILTSGTAILALSFSRPVIAPRSGLIPEVVSGEQQGYLFDSYSEMAQIMMRLAKSHEEGSWPPTELDFTHCHEELRWAKLVRREPFVELFGAPGAGTPPASKTYRYALVRILGNDLPFRHGVTQSIDNLKFTLENEPEFDGCKKVWVLNRIVDQSKRAALIDLLEAHGREWREIPFVDQEYEALGFNIEELPRPDFMFGEEYRRYSQRNKNYVEIVILKKKSNYLINNNGARNFALELGREFAEWVLPWDGNCYMTAASWHSFAEGVRQRADSKYHIVAMDRILDNADLLDPQYLPDPNEEPQIAFRHDAELRFDADIMYGFKPKVDLLKKLGVPGVWDEWRAMYPWTKHKIQHTPASFNYAWSGWVGRLFSGESTSERDMDERALKRGAGIIKILKREDARIRFSDYDRALPLFFHHKRLEQLKDRRTQGHEHTAHLSQLRALAKAHLGGPVYSVTSKTSLPPSGNKHDYWHPAPYAWPNPNTPDGLPYVARDGERVPGTRLYEEESRKYDRTSLQRMFDETTILALAGFVDDDSAYTQKAYRLIRAWFIDPQTAMNPHLKYSQVFMGKNGNLGTASGLIETKDFYFFLDAVRLVRDSGFWTRQDESAMNSWCGEFLAWLNQSEQGRKEVKAKNNHGNAFDLQTFALAAYLGDTAQMYDIMLRATTRLGAQIEPDGRQPHEMTRTTTAHYTAFNLQLWLNLNELFKNAGRYDLLQYEHVYGNKCVRPLPRALEWVLSRASEPWPYKQIDEFDRDRYQPLYHMGKLGDSELLRKHAQRFVSLANAKPYFFPHDGVAPFWALTVPQ